MKLFPSLTAVLLALPLPGAGAEKKASGPASAPQQIVVPDNGGRFRGAPPVRIENLTPAPLAVASGPAEVTDGGAADYTFAVRNDGTSPLPAPVTIAIEAFGLTYGALDTNGWTCVLTPPTGTCEWPNDVPAGGETATATASFDVFGPYGDAGDCVGGQRSPCAWFQATLDLQSARVHSVVVVNGNHPPFAGDDFATVGRPAVPTYVEVKANDGDTDFDPLVLTIVFPPDHGTVAPDPGSDRFLYTPDPSFAGFDRFVYRVTDPSGATATGIVTLGWGGVELLSTLANFGNVLPDHVSLQRLEVRNTTQSDLYGSIAIEPVPPAEIPSVLAGTGYDPQAVVYDPSVFQPRDTEFIMVPASGFPFFLYKTRPIGPVGRISLVRVRITLHPLSEPDTELVLVAHMVVRTGLPAEVPVLVNDDAVTVLMDRMTAIRPLGNDVSVAGIPLGASGVGACEPWNCSGPRVRGTVGFLEPWPFQGHRFTPETGFQGTTAFWYAASEFPGGNFSPRYDYAKVTVTVIPAPPPPVAVASGSATSCAGGPAPLTGSGGVRCSWTPAAGLDDPSSCTPIASPAATTTYALTVFDQFDQPSTNAATVTITVEALPIAAASGSATIPAGGSAALSGSGGVSCAWSPATGLDNPASCSPVASPAATTTYDLVVTSATGCTSTNPASATVTVSQLPVAVASGSATICAGGSAPLSGSGGVSCAWSPAAGLDDPTSCAPIASPAATTTYSLTVTDAQGQQSTNTATVTITVEDLPIASASGSTSIPVGGSAALSGSGGASCAWSPVAGLDDPASCTPIASPSSTTTYALVVTSGAGCSSTNLASATVTVVQPPVAAASGSAAVCAGGSAPLSGSGGVSCAWSPAAGLNDPASCNPVAGPATTTTYSLTVTDAYGQTSSNAATATITVNPLPIAVAGGTATITLGQSAPLLGSGGLSCAWSPGSGLDNAASCSPIATPTATTTYALVVTSAAGCVSSNPASATITVLPPSGGADLVVAAVLAPNQARQGEPIDIRAVTVNSGTAAAGSSQTRIYLSANQVLDGGDQLLVTAVVPSLTPGQFDVSATFTVPAPALTPGQYYLIAAADDGQVVAETNEANNTQWSRIHIKRSN